MYNLEKKIATGRFTDNFLAVKILLIKKKIFIYICFLLIFKNYLYFIYL